MAIAYVNVQDGGVDNCRTLTLHSVIIDPSCYITDFALGLKKEFTEVSSRPGPDV